MVNSRLQRIRPNPPRQAGGQVPPILFGTVLAEAKDERRRSGTCIHLRDRDVRRMVRVPNGASLSTRTRRRSGDMTSICFKLRIVSPEVCAGTLHIVPVDSLRKRHSVMSPLFAELHFRSREEGVSGEPCLVAERLPVPMQDGNCRRRYEEAR